MVSIAATNDGISHSNDVTDSDEGRARRAITQLKAMAHESRLAILFHLHDGAKSVSELEALLGLR
ncbi:MAG TPA: transcriptional regulator, partial [Rhizobiales bacterium]|nr:transcriptional regulator [Hyphomicrobiales bacterium]